VDEVELVSDLNLFQHVAFSRSFPFGWHTIRITNLGGSGGGWTNSAIRSDGFAITFPGTP
jgi:hypothetical protein